jgi:hypothetical protein
VWKVNLYTYSGRISYPSGSPSLLDIAVSLSRECRYAGAGLEWWPVALHTFVVCDLLPPELKLHGLLHDASECITGDIPKPAKSKETEELEDRLQRAIYRGLDLKYPTLEEIEAVHKADRRALHGEVHTVGTLALREVYPRDDTAEELVWYYYGRYPVQECVPAYSSCMKEFLYRYSRYLTEVVRPVC